MLQSNLGSVQSFGFIVWWEVKRGVYALLDLKAAGSDLPQIIRDGLTGETAETSFTNAVALRKKQYRVDSGRKDATAFYVTDNLGQGVTTLAREVHEKRGRAVEKTQMGSLTLEGYNIKFTPTDSYTAFRTEVDTLIGQFERTLHKRVGNMDDSRLRTLLLNWLETHYRTALRPTGGVYFLPLTQEPTQRDRVFQEMLAINQWLIACDMGELRFSEVFPSLGTNKVGIVNTLVEEVNEELATINASLDGYLESVGMNAGSLMYSTESQIKYLDRIDKKLRIYEDASLLDFLTDSTSIALAGRVGDLRKKAQAIYQQAVRACEAGKGGETLGYDGEVAPALPKRAKNLVRKSKPVVKTSGKRIKSV